MPVNLAVSLITVLASLPVRLGSVDPAALMPGPPVVLAITAGAMLAAYVGAGWLRRIPTAALARIIGALLGVVLLIEAALPLRPAGALPDDLSLRIAAGVAFGLDHSRKLADLVPLEDLRQARLSLIGSLDLLRYFNYDRNMETKNAVEALSALAQEHRLAVFRLLVCEGPNGLRAGEIAERIAVPPSTLSHHLAHLERAGLLRSWRVERRIFYAVDIEGTRRLVTFLTEDCCRGRPDMCGYASRGGYSDDHDLSQPGLRDVAECPCDDPELG